MPSARLERPAAAHAGLRPGHPLTEGGRRVTATESAGQWQTRGTRAAAAPKTVRGTCPGLWYPFHRGGRTPDGPVACGACAATDLVQTGRREDHQGRPFTGAAAPGIPRTNRVGVPQQRGAAGSLTRLHF